MCCIFSELFLIRSLQEVCFWTWERIREIRQIERFSAIGIMLVHYLVYLFLFSIVLTEKCKSIKAIKDDLYHKVIGTKCSGNFRSIPPVVFLGKGVLKICSKFTGEHPCRSAISVCKFAAYFQNTFSQEHLWRNASETSN